MMTLSQHSVVVDPRLVSQTSGIQTFYNKLLSVVINVTDWLDAGALAVGVSCEWMHCRLLYQNNKTSTLPLLALEQQGTIV